MNQKDFMEKVASVLRVTGVTKKIPQKRKEFKIIDPNGNVKKFIITEPPQQVIYTPDDCYQVLMAAFEVIRGAVRIGERVRLKGLCTIFAAYKEEYVWHNPLTGKMQIVKGHYTPKFKCHSALKQAASDYAKHLQELHLDAEAILKTTEEDEFYEEFDDEDDDYQLENYEEELMIEELVDEDLEDNDLEEEEDEDGEE